MIRERLRQSIENFKGRLREEIIKLDIERTKMHVDMHNKKPLTLRDYTVAIAASCVFAPICVTISQNAYSSGNYHDGHIWGVGAMVMLGHMLYVYGKIRNTKEYDNVDFFLLPK